MKTPQNMFFKILINRVSKFLYLRKKNFPGSVTYWEQRYSKGGNSGAGSYNQLAEFKAEILNSFVRENDILSVIEFGCGDGNQLTMINYPKYIGLDVSVTAIDICLHKFSNDLTKSFYLYNSNAFCDNHHIFKAELSLSLDVIFHLVEDEIFNKYMDHLFNASTKYVVIYASNIEGKASQHERNHKFTDWVDANKKNWKLLKMVENKYRYDKNRPEITSIADFYIYEIIS